MPWKIIFPAKVHFSFSMHECMTNVID